MFRRWEVHPRAPREFFQAHPHLPPLVAQLLYNRLRGRPGDPGPLPSPSAEGPSPETVRGFLAVPEPPLGDPFLLPDVSRALERLERALAHREHIAVYGDFDVDGVTSTALLVEALQHLGAQVRPYIPHRLREGYGLNPGAISALAGEGCTLLISADCGISAVAEVEQATKLGMEVIVTDHHAIPPRVAPALAVVDPRLPGSRYPFQELAGVGVAFKTAQALLRHHGAEAEAEERLLDLVALGTVADLVPLVGENRTLVRKGLEVLNHTGRPGLRELALASGLRLGELDTEDLAYLLGPRLNAAGRLDDAMASFRLLTTTHPEEARELAAHLETMNAQRQQLTTETLAAALVQARLGGQVAGEEAQAPLLFLAGPDFPEGILGLVASRLVEEYYRPAVAVSLRPKECRGSARSIPEFNMVEGLTRCQDLLVRYGGHAMAAGFTVDAQKLESLRERLAGLAAEALAGLDLHPTLAIDAEVRLERMTWELWRWLQRLGPYGSGNPAPAFLSRGVSVREAQTAGAQGQHLRLKLSDGRFTWPAFAFRQGDQLPAPRTKVDVVYQLERTLWNGEERLELRVLEVMPSPG